MAEPKDFPDKNDVLVAPASMPHCINLPIYRGKIETQVIIKGQQRLVNSPLIISCWKFTMVELEEIKNTGQVWLYSWAETHPPVAVIGTNPFGPVIEEQ